jgi:hypothetical protein
VLLLPAEVDSEGVEVVDVQLPPFTCIIYPVTVPVLPLTDSVTPPLPQREGRLGETVPAAVDCWIEDVVSPDVAEQVLLVATT